MASAADRELAHAVDQIQQLDGRMSGTLTVGAVPLAVMLLIPETLRNFGREFPDIQLRVIEELYIAQLTRLRQGEVDIALGPLPEQLPAGEFAVETPDSGYTRVRYELKLSGLKLPSTARPSFDRGSLAVAAAADGLGIALETSRLAEAELARGELIAIDGPAFRRIERH